MLPAADIRLALGKSGSGKTTLARAWVKGARRVLIFDPNGEAGWSEGATITEDPAELVELVSRKGRVRICWRGVMTGGIPAFEWANRCAWAGEGLHVVWDEVERFCEGGKLPPEADKLVQAGRHRDCRIIACTRRPYLMPRLLTSQATRMAIFRTTEPRDLDYFGRYVGEAIRQVPTLREYHALDWTEQGATVKKSPFR